MNPQVRRDREPDAELRIRASVETLSNFQLTRTFAPVSLRPRKRACNRPTSLGNRDEGLTRPVATLAACAAIMAGAIPTGCATGSKRDPEQSSIRYQLAVNDYQSRRVEAAIEELNQALKLDPENADAHNMLGIIALQQGADYVAQAETLACLKGPDAELVREDATKKFREAEEHLQRAVKFRDDFAMAWNNLAVAALQLQEWDLAASAATNALKVATYTEPEIARANLGWALFHKKELQKAWKELHDAVARSPGFCVGQYRLAKVYVERGEAELAMEHLDALVANKACPIQEAFLLGGLVAQRLKRVERARELFDRCASMAPRSCIAGECRRYTEMIH